MSGSPLLTAETFRTVVAATPLVSIDLVVENAREEILLGRRTNRPAADYWFVPGGRIRKNERLDEAFLRLATEELGVAVERTAAQLLGVYEHLYEDSACGRGVDTHYVVLGYHLRLDLPLDGLPQVQHSGYQWWSRSAMAVSDDVHGNSRAYLEALS